VVVVAERHFSAALGLFVVAGVSDGLDGFLAKRYGWTSRIGGLLDPLADKFLLMSCFVTLGVIGLIPVWLVAAVVTRDLVILGGAFCYQFCIEPLRAAPTVVSKLNTLCQLSLVAALLLDRGLAPLPPAWIHGLGYVVLATTLISGVEYVWIWGWRAWNHRRGSGRFP